MASVKARVVPHHQMLVLLLVGRLSLHYVGMVVEIKEVIKDAQRLKPQYFL